MKEYRGFLGRRDARRLIAGSMIARLPSAMLPLAIVLLVRQQTGSLAAAGVVVGAFGIGRAAVSPLVGALIDRLGRNAVLLAGAGAQAIMLVLLVGAAAVPFTVIATAAVAFVAGAATPPVQASLRALWPLVATSEAAQNAAYSFDATSQELIWIAGPLLVAALLSVASEAAILIVAAVVGCAGVAVFAASPLSRGWRGGGDAPRIRFGALSSRDLRALLVTSGCAGGAWGAMTFGLTALAVSLGNARASGLLLACVSAGSIAGGLLNGARTWSLPTVDRFRVLLIATAACALPLLFAQSIGVAAPLGLVAGLPLAASYAAMYVLTGRAAPRGTTTEAFTWTSSAFALGVALGTAAGGATSESFGLHAPFALAIVASAAAGLVAVLIRDREPARSMDLA